MFETRRSRLMLILPVWAIVVIQVIVFMWPALGWFLLLFVAMAVWTSWDYWSRGDLLGPIERTQAAGQFATDGWGKDH